ncbi:MAG TPA: hypothetical protein VGX68_01235 [Thermoanaerobaculia bacterium]|jgi:hypothetical protein|nr:hypothetical protein [Thermoanaerobaculia bacterium]
MRRKLEARSVLIYIVLFLSLAEAGLACGSTSGSAGPPLRVNGNPFPGINPPPAGKQQGVIGIQIGVFAPTVPTTCVCGLGLGQSGNPPPSSLRADQAVLTRYNPATGQHTILTEFVPLTLSSVTSQGLATGPGQLLPGSQWYGFSGKIQPFMTQLLMPGEIFLLNFALSFDPGQVAGLANLPIQFATGGGEPDGFPIFDPRDPHPVMYFGASTLPPCLPTQTVLCLNRGRFRVEVDWKDFDRHTGRGIVGSCPTTDSGNFAFFSSSNLEMLVKVLDACSFNNRYWVFFSAGTNVQFTLTVTDTKVPRIKQYLNPLGKPAPPVQDTSAFATCP